MNAHDGRRRRCGRRWRFLWSTKSPLADGEEGSRRLAGQPVGRAGTGGGHHDPEPSPDPTCGRPINRPPLSRPSPSLRTCHPPSCLLAVVGPQYLSGLAHRTRWPGHLSGGLRARAACVESNHGSWSTPDGRGEPLVIVRFFLRPTMDRRGVAMTGEGGARMLTDGGGPAVCHDPTVGLHRGPLRPIALPPYTSGSP